MTQIVDYRGLKPRLVHSDPTFVARIEAVLPPGAEFVKLTSTYWGVKLDDEEMYVLYDGEEFVVYEDDTEWASVAEAVLDFMDAESLKLTSKPSRIVAVDEDDEFGFED
jgi:hypothetical protein